jgi:CRISPR type IV-associated protein Csf2
MIELIRKETNSKTKNYTLEGIVKLLSPLSHSRGTESNTSELYTEKIKQLEDVDEVFIFKGNAFRGILRDCGMKYMLDKLNIKLPLKYFYALMSGGALEKVGDTSLDVEKMRKLKKAVPFLSVMGTAFGNRIIEGKLIVSPMRPICLETENLYITASGKKMETHKFWEQQEPLKSWRDSFDTLFATRTDDGKRDDYKQYIIQDNPQLLIEGSVDLNIKPKGDNEEQHQQMIYYIEVISSGTLFYHKMELKNVNEIELGSFVSALDEFALKPYIGGQSRQGFGEISMEYNCFEINGGKIQVDETLYKAKQVYDETLEELKEQYTKQLDKSEITLLLEAKEREE